MPRWLRRTLVVLGILVVVGAGAYYWFLVEGSAPGGLAPFAIDLDRVRALAAEPAGERPTEIRVEAIASGSFPATAVLAGEGWNGFPMVFASYQLVFPHQTIIVDTAIDEAATRNFGAEFNVASYQSMLAAMTKASQIVLTHEHPDHIGGILAHPDPAAIVSRLSLTVEQFANAGRFAGFSVPPGVLAEARPVAYDDYLAVAPGVVLIKAPGHSPGTQLIFVSRADGKEFLFAGDIGWSFRNIEEVRSRPRLVSQFMLNENRDAVFSQLAALHDLHGAEPDLVIVPGHDRGYIDGLVASALMSSGFVTQ